MSISVLRIVVLLHMFGCSNKTSITGQSIECKKCDISFLANASKLDTYEPHVIAEIFCTVDIACLDNIEFKEFSNEILFEVLNKNPDDFIEILKEQKEEKQGFLLNEFENPVSDAIDLDMIITKLSRQKNRQSKELISRLQKAKRKY